MLKIKKGDKVKILKGKDKGKTGKIERVFPKSDFVLVPGINQYKRHLKSKARNQKSEIVVITKPLPVVNVTLICPKCTKTTRVGFQFVNDNKVRICRKCEEIIA